MVVSGGQEASLKKVTSSYVAIVEKPLRGNQFVVGLRLVLTLSDYMII